MEEEEEVSCYVIKRIAINGESSSIDDFGSKNILILKVPALNTYLFAL